MSFEFRSIRSQIEVSLLYTRRYISLLSFFLNAIVLLQARRINSIDLLNPLSPKRRQRREEMKTNVQILIPRNKLRRSLGVKSDGIHLDMS